MKRFAIYIIVLMLGAMQAQAVDYKNNYRGRAVSRQQSAIRIQTTMPAVGFQSTSAYSEQLNQAGQQTTLNADGSVKGEAYGIGRYPGLKKDPVAPPPNPEDPDEEEDDGNTPIGDGLWVMMVLLAVYCASRVYRCKRDAGM